MVSFASRRRRAITLRTLSCGTASYEPGSNSATIFSSVGAWTGNAAAGAAAGATRPRPDLAASTSRAMTRPCGPEPSTRARSMPASFASRRASGDEKTRLVRASPIPSPSPRRAAGACVACAAARGASLGLAAGGGAGAGRAEAATPVEAGGGRLDVLPLLRQHGDERLDRHVLRALRHHDLGERALVDRLVFHRCLVGLDLGDHVAGLDLVALLLEPLGEVALLHGRRQRGHQDIDRHDNSRWSS